MTDWHICPDCGHETTTTTGLAAHGRQTHSWTPATNQARPGPNLPGWDAWTGTDPDGRGHDPDPRWRTDAACRGHDPQVFYPPTGDTRAAERARAICRGCPVQDACLTYALDTNQTHGIWGATSPVERRAIRRRRNVA